MKKIFFLSLLSFVSSSTLAKNTFDHIDSGNLCNETKDGLHCLRSTCDTNNGDAYLCTFVESNVKKRNLIFDKVSQEEKREAFYNDKFRDSLCIDDVFIENATSNTSFNLVKKEDWIKESSYFSRTICDKKTSFEEFIFALQKYDNFSKESCETTMSIPYVIVFENNGSYIQSSSENIKIFKYKSDGFDEFFILNKKEEFRYYKTQDINEYLYKNCSWVAHTYLHRRYYPEKLLFDYRIISGLDSLSKK